MTVRVSGPVGQGFEPMEPEESRASRRPHLSARTGLIALYAAFVALIAGGLTYLGDRRLATAVIAGGVAFGTAFVFFDKIIGD